MNITIVELMVKCNWRFEIITILFYEEAENKKGQTMEM